MSAEPAIALFERAAHNPSFETVRRSVGAANDTVDFCVPVNRHFPPSSLLEALRDALPDLVKYYPDYAEVHQRAVAELAGVPPEHVVVANGSTELITLLCDSAQAPIATPVPTFGRWTDLPRASGTPVSFLQHRRADDFILEVERIVAHVRCHASRTLVLCNPNNPTGTVLGADEIERLVAALAHLDLIVIDESFLDFAGHSSATSLVSAHPNVVVLKSLGKSIGWHGIRLGYAVAAPGRAEWLRARVPWWNVNGVAAFVLGRVAERADELRASFALVRRDREDMARRLAGIDGLRVFPSHANFLFAELDDGVSGQALRDRLLLEHGLMVRECGNKVGSSDRYLRLAVNLPGENERLAVALRTCLQGST